MAHLFAFGMGYSASALSRDLLSRGWRISGTSTRASGIEKMQAAGYTGVLFDGAARSEVAAALMHDATHVLVSAPPGAEGDPVLARHRDDLAQAPKLAWIGYLSTIGVYGDHGGAAVDEETPVAPLSERSRRRVEAERQWLAFGRDTGRLVEVFRLAGIYGPGRSAIDNLRSGSARRIVKPGQVFNRIHVDDIANVLAAAIDKRGSHNIYNVADDEPAPPQDVIAYAASLIGVAPPPQVAFAEAQLSEMAASFYAENKRATNARIKTELGVRLKYPTYREGLAAIAAAAKE